MTRLMYAFQDYDTLCQVISDAYLFYCYKVETELSLVLHLLVWSQVSSPCDNNTVCYIERDSICSQTR